MVIIILAASTLLSILFSYLHELWTYYLVVPGSPSKDFQGF